ncbi:glycine N-methyltransferase-like [Uloborus diversus]|uniref:glycine N-methyltransferase-like n=1 Tax=Uloborus diversus TaxID=327109 RepID=UPI00240A1760|nr:glycine N-methyltransferase-like [Uloborus diversus]
MVDTVFRARSLGVATEGLPDQYADGKAAKVWEVYIGEKSDRTKHYKDFLIQTLRDHNCNHLLDVACGTGIDSILLLEAGFQIMSVDASDKMLKYALKERWNRRKEPAFDKWVIEEANWLTLPDDIHKPNGGFDAVMNLGNSFAHLFDVKGDMSDIKLAIKNFHEMIKPGGYLLIDHRNYDCTLKHGKTPAHSIYYNSKHIKDIQTSILYTGQSPTMVMLDYTMDISDIVGHFDRTDSEFTKKGRYHGSPVDHFRLSYYPHRLETFTSILKEVFGENSKHYVYGDFKKLDEVKDPAFYIHFIQKAKE